MFIIKMPDRVTFSDEISNTVKPVYNGHPQDLRNWPLKYTGGRLIQDH